jgi:hypothetical protein
VTGELGLDSRGGPDKYRSTPSWSRLDVGIVGFGSTISFLSGLKEAHIRSIACLQFTTSSGSWSCLKAGTKFGESA